MHRADSPALSVESTHSGCFREEKHLFPEPPEPAAFMILSLNQEWVLQMTVQRHTPAAKQSPEPKTLALPVIHK